VTGLIFLVSQPQQYLMNPSMWFKVLFLIAAGANAMVFDTVYSERLERLGPSEDTPAPVKIIAGVSLVSWFAVLYFGRMIPYLVPDFTSGV
jgi:hypothetical protein